MSEQYPLFPELSEDGAKEAQALIDRFKVALTKAAEEAIGNLYCDIAIHIGSDSWTNYRNAMMDGYRNYSNRLVQGEHDFAEIRQAIYKEFREEINADLDQDNLKRIAELERERDRLLEIHSRYR
jgi:hypothetical protein